MTDTPPRNTEADDRQARENRIWRLAADLVITPVRKLPEQIVKGIYPDGNVPDGYFGIQRKRVRAFPKIVPQDVIDVLQAFGEHGSSYARVLEHFVKQRNLERESFAADLKKLLNALVNSNFLVEGGADAAVTEPVKPSFSDGDRWSCYRIRRNVHCMVDSEIYQVEHVDTGELAALKISRKHFPNEKMKTGTLERLTREFQTIARIEHPNVVKLIESGMNDGRIFGVLSWVDGPSVHKYVHGSEGGSDDGRILELAIECVKSLQAVHEAGYLHGDIHAGNFLMKEGHVCLVDFGLSRPVVVARSQQSQYSEGGVLPYMPPEYVRKELEDDTDLQGSIATEIYSCGVTVFSLFTNRYPYRWTPYRREFLNSILNDPPLTFEECEHTAWPEMEQLLSRALAKVPSERFASMAEFRRLLENIEFPHQPPYPGSRESQPTSQRGGKGPTS